MDLALAPMAPVGSCQYGLVVQPDMPARSLAELLAHVRRQPCGELTCSSGGAGAAAGGQGAGDRGGLGDADRGAAGGADPARGGAARGGHHRLGRGLFAPAGVLVEMMDRLAAAFLDRPVRDEPAPAPVRPRSDFAAAAREETALCDRKVRALDLKLE